MLFYMSEEGQEGRNAYVEKRRPDFSGSHGPLSAGRASNVTSARDWVAGGSAAYTLPAAVVPVVVGTAVASPTAQ